MAGPDNLRQSSADRLAASAGNADAAEAGRPANRAAPPDTG